ncbi:MAG: hypothetical protein PHX08_21385 [Lachnospiraceae bacterium]|nr:hypothetical protein [Lachnospiraceae bacterium]
MVVLTSECPNNSYPSTYGVSEPPKAETISQGMERYQKEKAEQPDKPNYQKKNRGAR